MEEFICNLVIVVGEEKFDESFDFKSYYAT